MKNKCLLWVIFLLQAALLSGQGVGINDDGQPPHPSAMLDVRSVERGLLIPRMSAEQRLAIAEAAVGLLVYQTDQASGFYYFQGSSWHYLHGEDMGFGQVADADGHFYPVVEIGGRRWMARNLASTRFSNGEPIPAANRQAAWSEAGGPVFCSYHDMQAVYAADYGLLYNWEVVNDARGVCPPGWRIPEEADWQALEEAMGEEGTGALLAGGFWDGGPLLACNATGFSAVPSGLRLASGEFAMLNTAARFWSLEEAGPGSARSVEIIPGGFSVQASDRQGGQAIRCIY